MNSCILTTCRARTWAPRRRPALVLGAGVLGSRCSEYGLEGAGLQVATPPGPLWLYLGRVKPQDDGAGPRNQRFSNCTVSRTHLGLEILSQEFWDRDKIPCPNSSQASQCCWSAGQSSGAGWAEFFCKGPGSTFPDFVGFMVSVQENIYFCFIDYPKAFVDHNK